MRKIKLLLLCLLMAIGSVIIVPKTSVANAVSGSISYTEYSTDVQQILTDFCAYKTRTAGSENEKAAANYIKNYLTANAAGVTAKNTSSINNGLQTFNFISDYTDTYLSSQNVVFEYKSATTTDKKIIICCNYDAPFTYDTESQKYVSLNNDALNSSAASVASTLMLAKNISSYNLKFNVEFVFFGASESSFAGSEFYTNGISDKDKENILCVINIDKVALGNKMYFYIDEVSTDFSNYVANTISIFSREVNLLHLNKIEGVSNELGLSYTHIAMNSDNIKFMKNGITTISFFAGDYESGLKLGLNEYDGKEVVTNTENDTISYINENYGTDVVYKNLFRLNNSIETLICNSNFQSSAENLNKNTSWLYSIFANSNLVIYLSAVAFIVILIVAMRIYLKLTVKSYYANVEVEFLSSVLKITEQVDQKGEDKEAAKIVGQVIANDIKKNKTLKPEKDKKKK